MQHKRNQNFNFLVIKIKFKHPSILSLFIKLESHFSLVHVQDSFDRSLFDDEFERKRGEREREGERKGRRQEESRGFTGPKRVVHLPM